VKETEKVALVKVSASVLMHNKDGVSSTSRVEAGNEPINLMCFGNTESNVN
jgi:hypothetical protein